MDNQITITILIVCILNLIMFLIKNIEEDKMLWAIFDTFGITIGIYALHGLI